MPEVDWWLEVLDAGEIGLNLVLKLSGIFCSGRRYTHSGLVFRIFPPPTLSSWLLYNTWQGVNLAGDVLCCICWLVVLLIGDEWWLISADVMGLCCCCKNGGNICLFWWSFCSPCKTGLLYWRLEFWGGEEYNLRGCGKIWLPVFSWGGGEFKVAKCLPDFVVIGFGATFGNFADFLWPLGIWCTGEREDDWGWRQEFGPMLLAGKLNMDLDMSWWLSVTGLDTGWRRVGERRAESWLVYSLLLCWNLPRFEESSPW